MVLAWLVYVYYTVPQKLYITYTVCIQCIAYFPFPTPSLVYSLEEALWSFSLKHALPI